MNGCAWILIFFVFWCWFLGIIVAFFGNSGDKDIWLTYLICSLLMGGSFILNLRDIAKEIHRTKEKLNREKKQLCKLKEQKQNL